LCFKLSAQPDDVLAHDLSLFILHGVHPNMRLRLRLICHHL
jgi:hypothetical protein